MITQELSGVPVTAGAISTASAGKVRRGGASRKWSDWSICSNECIRTRIRLNCDDLKPMQSNSMVTTTTSNVPNGRKLHNTKFKDNFASKIKRQVELELERRQLGNDDIEEDDDSNNDDRDDDPETLERDESSSSDQDYPNASILTQKTTNHATTTTSGPIQPATSSASLPITPAIKPAKPPEGDREDEEDNCSGIERAKTFQSIACTGGLCPVRRLASEHTKPETGNPKRRLPNTNLVGQEGEL